MHIKKSTFAFVVAFAVSAPIATLLAESFPIPAGTQITVRTVDRIESRQAEVGANYRCTVDAPVILAGKEVAGRGADCVLRVTETKQAGKFKGSTQLKLELSQLRVNKDLVDVSSDPSQMEGGGKGKSSGIKTGIGAAAGAGLGGLLGGKKGAAVGAGAGAAAGLTTAALTRGPEIRVAPETILKFVVQ